MSKGELIKHYRESAGLSQTLLAEKAKLSLRTVQRIENDETDPRGHSLNALAAALNLSVFDLTTNSDQISEEVLSQVKAINASALFGVVFPFGSLLFPNYYWRKFKSNGQVNSVGRRIINFQILWSIVTYLLLVVAPFVGRALNLSIPLILILWILALLVNVIMVFRMSKQLAIGNLDIYKTGVYFI